MLLLFACAREPVPPTPNAETKPSFEDTTNSFGPPPSSAVGPQAFPKTDTATPDTAPEDTGTVFAPVPCGDTIEVPQAGYELPIHTAADLSQPILGVSPTPAHLHVSSPARSALAFLWTTDSGTLASELEMIAPDGTVSRFSGASFFLLDDDANLRHHEVHVCGIPAGSNFSYRVGGDGAWSPDVAMRSPRSDTATVVVIGDTRDNPSIWGMLLKEVELADPDVILFTGDAVASGKEVDQWYTWLEEGAGVLDHRLLLATHGNHEGMSQAWFGIVAQPGNEQWYSADIGPAHVVFFNDSGLSTEVDDQTRWLAEDLAATTAPWKLSVHHQPAFSSSTVHAISSMVRDQFVPVLEANGVNVDLAGHNHHYERMLPMRGGVFSPGGPLYIVTAGGGAPFYSNDGHMGYSVVVSITNHFTLMKIDATHIEGQAIDLAGNILDNWTLKK